MQDPHGSYYSAFVWKFANTKDNPSFEEFVAEPYDLGYVIICISFVLFGMCGMFLNGRNIYTFLLRNTVSRHGNFD